MDQLKGSLRFIPLPAVTQFIAGLGSTGRLKIGQGTWSGEIALREGWVIAAQLGAERGRAALEGMMLALTEADFAFVDGPVEAAEEPLLSRDEPATYLAGLVAERERLQLGFNALGSVPRLVDQDLNTSESSQVTISAAALQLIPALVHGHTLEQIAQRRGLARTLREVALLRAGGLVRLDPAAASPRASAPAPAATADSTAPAAAATPPRALTPAVRPLRPVGLPARTPQSPRRATWWQAGGNASASTATAPVELPRPRLVTDDEPRPHRLAAVPDEPTPAIVPQEPPTRGRNWRQALVGLFVAETTPQR
ncbi:MAG: DUF4388 domain-containing protein [Chloroflexi bacterium]|nr:DUF4388 domain-containing protein [Chloroflexota bacterium]